MAHHTNLEDEYFAREEIETKRKLAHTLGLALKTKEREELRKLHHMHCPKCGMKLETLEKGHVEVDMCFHCGGIWLDQGELEQLLAEGQHKGGAVMGAVLNIVKDRP